MSSFPAPLERRVADFVRQAGGDAYQALLTGAATGDGAAVEKLATALKVDKESAARLALGEVDKLRLPAEQVQARRDRLTAILGVTSAATATLQGGALGEKLAGKPVVDPQASTALSQNVSARIARKQRIARDLGLIDASGAQPKLTERGEALLSVLGAVEKIEKVTRTPVELARLKMLPREGKIGQASENDPTAVPNGAQRFVASGTEESVQVDPPVKLETTSQEVSLYLKSLTLNESFDFKLFGQATNDVYVIGMAWDLSGKPPQIFPPDLLTDTAKLSYRLQKGEKVTFVGNGLQLKAKDVVKGGLFVRLIVMENDGDARELGEKMQRVRKAIEDSHLTQALAALAAASTAGTIAAVGAAALATTNVVAEILKENKDDVVAVFDGTYGPEFLQTTRDETYDQRGATIQLGVAAG